MSDLGFAIFLLTHQKEGTSFCAPKIGYRSQKQPVLAPDHIHFCSKLLCCLGLLVCTVTIF